MSNEDNKILKNNPEGKSMKTPAIIYADLECLLEKIHSCQNNPENPTQKKKLCMRILGIHYLQIVCFTQQSCA